MLAAYTRLHSAVENRLLPHGDRRNLHLGTVPPHRAAPLEPMTPPIAHCTAFAVRCFRTSALRACLSLSLAFLVFLHGSSSTFAANVGGTWKSVAVSGAQCLVTAVITHPSGLVCIRTDVGGAYRWDRPTSTWVPLTDFLSFDRSRVFSMRIPGHRSGQRECHLLCRRPTERPVAPRSDLQIHEWRHVLEPARSK